MLLPKATHTLIDELGKADTGNSGESRTAKESRLGSELQRNMKAFPGYMETCVPTCLVQGMTGFSGMTDGTKVKV